MLPTPKPAKNATASSYSFVPPARGLVLNEPLANAKPGGALRLENFFPTATGIRTRGGSTKYATIGTDPVLRMWTYKSGIIEEFFASDASNIFNVTTVVDADTAPTADVTGQSSGYYSVAQFGTAGGDYLYAVNGTNSPRLYDGSTWVAVTGISTPAITGVTTSGLSFVWSFASRLFFIETDSLNVWYLPVDSIGGAAAQFSLAGVFQEGGSLLFGGKWSVDAGDGLDDKWVVVSSTGEVAVYQGTDPGDANNWSKVGIYKITPPLGPNAFMSAGGDMLISTEDGVVPISEAINKDPAALSLAAVSVTIEPLWKEEVVRRRTMKWEMMKWPSNNMMVISLPVPDIGIDPGCLVCNLETGAWSTFGQWDCQSLVHFSGQGYFGTSTGTIHSMETAGSDDGVPYVCTYVGLPDNMRSMGVYKTIHSARAIFQSNVLFAAKISVSVNYKISLPSPPNSPANFTVDQWDVGLWDVALWDANTAATITPKWVSIGKSGTAVSPQIQITCGTVPVPTTELVQFDVIYDRGGVMV